MYFSLPSSNMLVVFQEICAKRVPSSLACDQFRFRESSLALNFVERLWDQFREKLTQKDRKHPLLTRLRAELTASTQPLLVGLLALWVCGILSIAHTRVLGNPDPHS